MTIIHYNWIFWWRSSWVNCRVDFSNISNKRFSQFTIWKVVWYSLSRSSNCGPSAKGTTNLKATRVHVAAACERLAWFRRSQRRPYAVAAGACFSLDEPRERKGRRACTQRKSATRSRRLRTRFALCVAALFRRRGDRLRLRGPPVPAARPPRHAAPSRASPRKPGERTRCAILAASFTRRSFSSLRTSPPPDPQHRSLPSNRIAFLNCSPSLSANFSRESKNIRTQIESEKGATDRIFAHTLREGLPNSISACIRLIGGDIRDGEWWAAYILGVTNQNVCQLTLHVNNERRDHRGLYRLYI